MDRDDPSMVWEKRWVARPVNTHFSADDSSPLARSDETNRLVAQAELGPRVDEDEDEDGEQGSDLLKWAAVLVAGVLLGAGAIKAAPRIVSWRRNRRVQAGSASDTGPVDDEVEPRATDVMSSPATSSAVFESEVEVALEDHRESISSAEAQRRIFAILVAAAFIADQMRELSNVRIADHEASPELQGAMDRLSAPQLTESLNRMLEADSSLLDDETAAKLMETFGGGQVVEGQFVPLRNDKVKEALRLTRPEEASPESEQ